jgi:uncharacterized protein (UPF0332 family)
VVSEGDCRQRAESDWLLAQELATTGRYNWAITLAFYSALHHVNALMVRGSRYTDDMDHPVRMIFLREHHPAIEVRYSNMLGKSIRARYEVGWVADEDSYQRQVRQLNEVRDYVDRAMAGRIPGIAQASG